MRRSGADAAEQLSDQAPAPVQGYVLEVTVAGDASERDAVHRWLRNYPFEALRDLGTIAADVYVPAAAQAKDPYNDTRGAPLAQLILGFSTADSLEEARSSSLLCDSFSAPSSAVRLSTNPLLRCDYPVEGERCESQDPEGISYVVRYHGPTENQGAFVDSYLTYHPAVLATLPNIRNIICYIPLKISSMSSPNSSYVLGNEVMFKTIDDFNEAMQSNARRRMRENRHPGPIFTGKSTHFPMERRRQFGPDAIALTQMQIGSVG
jgi:hypothetical protein